MKPDRGRVRDRVRTESVERRISDTHSYRIIRDLIIVEEIPGGIFHLYREHVADKIRVFQGAILDVAKVDSAYHTAASTTIMDRNAA